MGCGHSRDATVNKQGNPKDTFHSHPKTQFMGKYDERQSPNLHGHDDTTVECSAKSEQSEMSLAQGQSEGCLSQHNPDCIPESSILNSIMLQIEKKSHDDCYALNSCRKKLVLDKNIEEIYDGVFNGPILGEGIDGIVRLITHRATGRHYALKTISLEDRVQRMTIPSGSTSVVSRSFILSNEFHRVCDEIQIMCQLNHPNVVQLEQVYASQFEIFLVEELCLPDTLFDRLEERSNFCFSEAECALIIRQVLTTVTYLHSHGVIHRDIKLENILFADDGVSKHIKLIDFGESATFHPGAKQDAAVGTPYTVAPEIILGSYDERCDLWSVGVITFLLLCGEPPFGGCGEEHGESLQAIRSNILNGRVRFEPDEIWSKISVSAKEFISALLVLDPNKRLTALEARHHKWLEGV